MVNQVDFKLRFQQTGGRWSEIPIPEGDLKIGRRSNNNLQLRGRTVSREHAEIRRRGQNLWIADLGSTTGTWVNGQKLAGPPQKLLPGQTIKIGNFTLQIITIQAETPTPGQRPGHIFISYSRADHELVYPLAQKLEADGFKVWIDRLDIPAGNPWRSEIVEAIAESDAFVLLLSPTSTASKNVLAELNIAIGERIKVMPVILRSVQIPNDFKYQLSGINRVDLLENPRLGYSQLTNALRAHQRELARQPVRPIRLTRQVEMVLHDIKLKAFNQQKERELLNFLAQKTGFSPSRFAVAGLVAGSVRVTVNMPAEAAYQIIAQALNKDPGLLAAGISALRLDGHADFIHIGGPPPPGGPPPDSPKAPPSSTPGGIASMGGLKWLLLLAGVVASIIIYNEIRTDEGGQVPPVVTEVPVLTNTASLTPSVTSSITPSPTPVTLTPTVTSTQTRTPTPSPTGSITPSPTYTRTPTNTPSTTATYTPTNTPTLTPTPEFGLTLQPGGCATFYDPGEYVEIIYGANVDGRILLTFFPPDGGAALHLLGIGGTYVSANEPNTDSLEIPDQPGTWVIQAELLDTNAPEIYCEFIVYDITAPIIQEINVYQDFSCYDYSVDLFLDVWDESFIEQVYYQLSGGEWQEAERIDDYTFMFSVYVPNEYGSEYFFISAEDEFGNSTPVEQLKLYSRYDPYAKDIYTSRCYLILVMENREFVGTPVHSTLGDYDPLGCQNLMLKAPSHKNWIAYTSTYDPVYSTFSCEFYNEISETISSENATSGYIIYSPSP